MSNSVSTKDEINVSLICLRWNLKLPYIFFELLNFTCHINHCVLIHSCKILEPLAELQQPFKNLSQVWSGCRLLDNLQVLFHKPHLCLNAKCINLIAILLRKPIIDFLNFWSDVWVLLKANGIARWTRQLGILTRKYLESNKNTTTEASLSHTTSLLANSGVKL